ncbi:Signal transduction histidine kinase involved in nitrogen fixation and metabolism regulation [Candidatus Terasakiella magnetica]|nr:Signal transduction histidine kinase involved in nitrogen fixation and metabolism regulation [Candidatus Terasakiella magnetica]
MESLCARTLSSLPGDPILRRMSIGDKTPDYIWSGKAGDAAHAGSGAGAWKLRVVAAVAVLGVLLTTAWRVWSEYRDALTDAGTLSTALARVAEEHVSGMMRSIEHLLLEVAEIVPPDRPVSANAFITLVGSRATHVPFVRSVFVAGADGVVEISTLPGMSGIDIRDRDYFVALANDPSRTYFVTGPIRSRAQAVISIFIARALRDAAGTFRGVAVVAIDPKLFEDELRSVQPPEGGFATLLLRDGTILSRVPDAEKWTGKWVGNGQVVRQLAKEDRGLLVGYGKTEENERIVAFRQIKASPLVVAVGIRLEAILARWRTTSLLQAAAAAIVAVLAVLLVAISERRMAERLRIQAVLAAAEARFRNLSERSPIGMFLVDPPGFCSYVNQRWLTMTGRTREQILGRKWCGVIHAGDQYRIRQMWNEVIAARQEFCAEIRIVTADGQIRWVRVHVSAAATDGDDLLVGTFEDITESKGIETRLRQSEEKFAKAFKASPDALVISAQGSGRYIEVNDAFCRLLGRERADFIGNDALTLGVWANTADRDRLITMIEAETQVAEFEARLRRKDGKLLTVTISAQPILFDDERCLLFICRDIGERKEMEARTRTLLAKLDASNKELEQFAYVTSHDLQEPLRMIAGYAQLIDRRYRGKLDAEADEFLDFLVDGAKRMQGMIQDLLEFSRVERRGGEFVEFDAAEAMEDVLYNLQVALKESGGEVGVGELPRITADRSQFVRLLQNLLGNAIKYRHAERPPRLTVTAEAVGDDWVFAVTDNGIGIESQYFDRIFQVFQRLHTREQYPGTGIGLAICKKIVERHGGRLWVESEPGQGSTFRFSLPVSRGGVAA